MLILAGFVSCGMENTDDTSFRSEDSVIKDTVNGIEFIFCLLNKDGEPSTIFNEGENFSFYFKCTNLNANNEIKIVGDFISHLLLDGFCRVISQQNYTINS
jgi:hypothetical protein